MVRQIPLTVWCATTSAASSSAGRRRERSRRPRSPSSTASFRLRRYLEATIVCWARNRELDTVLNACNLTHANRDFGGDDAAAGDGMESTESASRLRADDGLPA